ncbi:tripartite tricarboxylate transporter substrate binding protein [Bordetella parapertussis]|uniref:Exported protein n=6 Tax=Bordetella TaxID=517 RepID=K0MJM7_BORPB|nr:MULTISPECIES: tripartite tricarboxylate transporter substrate binding protein [Bordetella]KDC43442.1 tripartite tricarboxylate transporter family receptor [Bordetella bronchiseptica M435/02/3]CAE33555.1 putative exported protein [Bordetella bronchiseptica RB50]CCJ50131.1 putative exported protein [Bordetella parapertussis Bpp5]CCJ52783.1 putative exported protein [Bordetella bronchiseptica 253]AMG90881.1 tripartite tricarboxylate transporter substrate binding protein [Bordetella bronchisept
MSGAAPTTREETGKMKTSMHFVRTWCGALCALVVLAGASLPARAEYPTRSVTLIVPFPAGGSVDMLARLFAAHVGEPFKDKVVVINRPGASGVVGETAMARAEPDGYTIMFQGAPAAINAEIYKQPLYDAKDLQPVGLIMTAPFVVATYPESEIKTLADIKTVAAGMPNGLTTAEAGISTRLVAEMYRLITKDKLYLVPYNGGPAAAMSLVRHETGLYFSDLTSVTPYILSGQFRPLAVTSAKRVKDHPTIPTTAEAGVPEFTPQTWFGVFTRTGTPPEIVQALNQAVDGFLRNPAVIQKIEQVGGTPTHMSVAQFEDYYGRQRLLWRDVIKRAEIPLQ